MNVSRSTIITGAILGAFVLYVLAKGDAAQYLDLMTPSTQAAGAAGGTAITGGTSGGAGTGVGGNLLATPGNPVQFSSGTSEPMYTYGGSSLGGTSGNYQNTGGTVI